MTNPGNPGTWQMVATGFYNGFTVYTMQLVGYMAPTYSYDYSGCTYIPYVAAGSSSAGGWNPPGSGPISQGFWYSSVTPLSQFRCKSDGSWPMDRVYPAVTSPGITLTNYEANWNAFGDSGWKTGDGDMNYAGSGYAAKAQKISTISDGLSNTVYLGEAYAYCDRTYHSAFYSWCPGGGTYGQTFGLTWPIGVGGLDGSSSPAVALNTGMPNTLMFQIQPLPLTYAACGGKDCCSPWQIQTPHSAMPIGMGDGSMRSVTGQLSQDMWRYLCQPRDGQSVDDSNIN